jgi:hypothetical protein
VELDHRGQVDTFMNIENDDERLRIYVKNICIFLAWFMYLSLLKNVFKLVIFNSVIIKLHTPIRL